MSGFFDFKAIRKELEDYRQNDMSTFQKLHHFFITFTNDSVSDYVNGRKSFEDDDEYEQCASRDFLLRQLRI